MEQKLMKVYEKELKDEAKKQKEVSKNVLLLNSKQVLLICISTNNYKRCLGVSCLTFPHKPAQPYKNNFLINSEQ